jgi:N-methylhydantoinase A/oxoprolinase/acetone carboxylase beta subunit
VAREVLVGVDVGGTFTDAVAVRGGEVLAAAKEPTRPEALAASILGALDGVLGRVDPVEVARLSLSTTLVTNTLAQGLAPRVALVLSPGPGIHPTSFRLPGPSRIVGGAIDFRGRELAPWDRGDLARAAEALAESGIDRVAVVGKFSPRNPSHEEAMTAWLAREHPGWRLRAGHTVSGRLNFPRRAAATAFTLAVEDAYRAFFQGLREALGKRDLDCPIYVLKADGGTLPLAAAEDEPLESVFSGPAASALGALALRPPGATSVVVDVGGSTTDLALILDGEPVFAAAGASLEGIPLPVRALATRSLPVGGDSAVVLEGGGPALAKTRKGVAAALGGPAPTLTDALVVLGCAEVGDEGAARSALAALGEPGDVARLVVEDALARLAEGIEAMLESWRREPVYRLWQLRQKEERRPEVLVGLGAAAEFVVPALAERLGVEARVPDHAPVANALGAAVARTTYSVTLHVDTERDFFEVAEVGVTRRLNGALPDLREARAMARRWMARRGEALGIEAPLEDVVEVLAEQFNVVEGWQTVGRIFDVVLERPAGLVEGWVRDGTG